MKLILNLGIRQACGDLQAHSLCPFCTLGRRLGGRFGRQKSLLVLPTTEPRFA